MSHQTLSKKKPKIISIEFIDSSFMSPRSILFIGYKDNKVLIRYTEFDDVHVNQPISNIAFDDFIKQLVKRAQINKWKQYDQLGILDGEVWELNIEYASGYTRHSYGFTEYPKTFQLFKTMVKQFLKTHQINQSIPMLD